MTKQKLPEGAGLIMWIFGANLIAVIGIVWAIWHGLTAALMR